MYLYGPLAVLVAFSFNDNRIAQVWTEFSTKWYVKAFSNEAIQNAIINSNLLQSNGYITDFNRMYLTLTDNAVDDIDDLQKKDFIIESGQAMGVDFVLKYNTKKLYLWGVYSLGKVTRWDGYKTYAPIFDRRHNVNLVGSYNFGKNESWEATVRWNLGTGFPFKQTKGVGEITNIGSINEAKKAPSSSKKINK